MLSFSIFMCVHVLCMSVCMQVLYVYGCTCVRVHLHMCSYASLAYELALRSLCILFGGCTYRWLLCLPSIYMGSRGSALQSSHLCGQQALYH